MRTLTFLLSVVILCFAAFTPVMAATLTSDQVKNFTSTIPAIEGFSEQMKKEGKDKALENAVRPKPGETQFSPYTKGVVVLKTQFPDDYKKLADVVSKHGFASSENWADVGDSVMHAYLATKMQGQNMQALEAMSKMTPEMKAKLPPQAKAQVEQASAMIKLVNSAPAANKEAIKPHIPEIDAWLKREETKMKAAAAANAVPKTQAPAKAPAAPAPAKSQ